ncbi:MAG: alanine racemase [Alphaproteobacteria bacterium]|jgi:alanine racemase|nr:alanine racemase [Alphaproteobacteria bacterium]
MDDWNEASLATRPSWMELDLDALAHNYRSLRASVGPEVKIIPALKANGYGHGVAQMARLLARFDVHALATGSFEDAKAIREAGIELPILMFGGALPEGMATLLALGLTPTVYDLAGAEAVSAAATEPSPVYVKVDAGLGRLGVALPDAFEFIKHLTGMANLVVEGVYTHLSFFDPEGREWSRRQLRAFDALLDELAAAGIEVPVTQALASSTLMAGLESHGNAVCPGHLLYGVPSVAPEVAPIAPYRPVLSAIRSRLIHAGPLKAGMRDAGRNAPGRVGVIPLGLADGCRAFLPDAPAAVLIDGRRAPVRGVSLEHMTLDLTDFEAAGVGDEVVVMGRSGDDEIGLGDIAAWQGTRQHHVLMAFDGRLPCRYLGPSD